jgi:hypothetical protein
MTSNQYDIYICIEHLHQSSIKEMTLFIFILLLKINKEFVHKAVFQKIKKMFLLIDKQ